MIYEWLKRATVVALVVVSVQASALSVSDPQVKSFIEKMHKKHGFDVAVLQDTFSKVQKNEKIIATMTRPYESKPWYIYRRSFLTDQRIAGGVAFWNTHAALLKKEERMYGVPAQVVVAFIGVESFYGSYKGRYKVINALSTLSFDYPKRAKFFQSELEEFLLMCREKDIDVMEPVGSYAGAMGWPQFMPSSYRRHAVSFEKKHHPDIWHAPSDVIASIGNYLQVRGKWQVDQPIADKVRHPSPEAGIKFNKGRKPTDLVSAWAKRGLSVSGHHALKAGALRFDMGDDQYEYWLAHHNFYAIMSYNPRVAYAMAVYQLSLAIKDAHDHQSVMEK